MGTFTQRPRPLRAPVHTVEVIAVETDPINRFYDREDWDPLYEQIPEPFMAALKDVIDNFDERQCARCGNPVGYATVNVTQNGMDGEDMRWHWTSLSRVPPRHFPEAGGHNGSPVVLLCEDCTPYLPDVPLTM